MIFTKADGEKLESAASRAMDLRLDIGSRDDHGKREPTVHDKLNTVTALLNELGAAVGRIDTRFEATSESQTIRHLALMDTVRGRSDMTNNAIVVLSGRLSALEEKIERIEAMFKNAVFAAMKRKQRKARRKKK